jgi:hypothetical protein
LCKSSVVVKEGAIVRDCIGIERTEAIYKVSIIDYLMSILCGGDKDSGGG